MVAAKPVTLRKTNPSEMLLIAGLKQGLSLLRKNILKSRCSGEERVRQSMAANSNPTTEVLAGLVYARKLLRAFGGQVFDVIEAEPHRLREVAGIGPKRADGIATGWAEQRAIREIAFLIVTTRCALSGSGSASGLFDPGANKTI